MDVLDRLVYQGDHSTPGRAMDKFHINKSRIRTRPAELNPIVDSLCVGSNDEQEFYAMEGTAFKATISLEQRWSNLGSR